MATLDLNKDDLLDITDTQLENLIALLAEAEIGSNNGRISGVNWSGSINAADGGIDIKVSNQLPEYIGDFVPRAKTSFQAKISKMPASAIEKEMKPKGGALLPSISKLAEGSGSYIIVSLKDDNAPNEYEKRVAAMKKAVSSDPNATKLLVDFYDRSKLLQWVRQYPGVMLWLRSALGKPLSGWKGYDRWSQTPRDHDDSMIFDEGISVRIPGQKNEPISFERGLIYARSLVRTTQKSTRIVGLSGVGKTRFVQALFEGDDALDKTTAIYVDEGDEPNPSARQMLEALIANKQEAIIVLDNCSSSLHGKLSRYLDAISSNIKLITVEYDIREDKPRTTEIIQLEAFGPEICEKLVLRRYPRTGQINARRVAEFAGGNLRIGLAVAERVQEGEDLTQLSDEDLFERLFEQRHRPDQNLQESAEVLALVYSYSIDDNEKNGNELRVLSSISSINTNVLYRSTSTLMKRGLVQKRNHWRAALPQLIANRLAKSALDNIQSDTIINEFEKTENRRLLKSFSHRIGFLHDHEVVQDIAANWLAPGGLLSAVYSLDEDLAAAFEFISPIDPELTLNTIFRETEALEARVDQGRLDSIARVVHALAYDAHLFDRAAYLLTSLSIANDRSLARDMLKGLCQLYLSGTQAKADERAIFVRNLIFSKVIEKRYIGFELLVSALQTSHWTGMYAANNQFGTRSRDHGWQPKKRAEVLAWFQSFLDIVNETTSSNDAKVSEMGRNLFAERFSDLWRVNDLGPELAKMTKEIHNQNPYPEGWMSIQHILFFQKHQHDDEITFENIELLKTVHKELTPIDTLTMTRAIVLNDTTFGGWYDDEYDDSDPDKYSKAEKRLNERATELGRAFVTEGLTFDLLDDRLFSQEYMPHHYAFGVGLAQGVTDVSHGWASLISNFKSYSFNLGNHHVLSGYLQGAVDIDPNATQTILDNVADDDDIRRMLVDLHPAENFNDRDFDRIFNVAHSNDISAHDLERLLWRKEYAHIAPEKNKALAEKMMTKPNGSTAIVEAMNMRLYCGNKADDVLGDDFRSLGMHAVADMFNRSDDNSGMNDYHLSKFLDHALSFDKDTTDIDEIIANVFAIVDIKYGMSTGFDKPLQTIVKHYPEKILEQIFSNSTGRKNTRHCAFHNGLHDAGYFDDVSVKWLAAWCAKSNVENIWQGVAELLRPFGNRDEDDTEFTPQALEFLELSSSPEQVLRGYRSKLLPKFWVGSLSYYLMQRREAFAKLSSHSNIYIVETVTTIIEEIDQSIEAEQAREKERDERDEQKFE